MRGFLPLYECGGCWLPKADFGSDLQWEVDQSFLGETALGVWAERLLLPYSGGKG